MDDLLPPVRIPSELRQKLELIAEVSVAQSLGAHIRFAVDRYVHENWTPELQAKLNAGPVTETDEPATT